MIGVGCRPFRPTAHTPLVEEAATPFRKPKPVSVIGAPGTTLQAVPFQCSISGSKAFPTVPDREWPTAQMSLAETAVIASSSPPTGSCAGDGTTDQAGALFLCSIRLWFASLPTAHALVVVAVTACSRVSSPGVCRFCASPLGARNWQARDSAGIALVGG